ncbi:MAG: hydroxymethylbilane synthase [Thermaurantimonas sp.]
MIKTIRIGTRDSQLALWQAEFVAGELQHRGIACEIHTVKSEGDINLTTPLYQMGIQGIFTKTLDIALLDGRIDIAVHSYKDVPTALPAGLIIAAVPQRGKWTDTLVSYKPIEPEAFSNEKKIVATGSIRRKAQWLHTYPNHEIVPLRGNVITRLEKLLRNNWDAAIFATAGLQRLNAQGFYSLELASLPAPGQGALAVVARKGDESILEKLKQLHHPETAFCVSLEKAFLKTLEGGCSSPIACLASRKENQYTFKGELYDPNNPQERLYTEFTFVDPDVGQRQVQEAATKLLEKKKSGKQ